ncbi:ATP-binding cassette domain-containing protein [Senegalimassilia anaerobia]|uniref:ATP-binding cassette domain-containing protein n=1 Tax=Senegalimassilia anaerobia TaxID=1473216 RepID=UPI003AAC95BA
MSGGSIEIREMVARRGSFSLRVDELHIEPHEIFAIVGEAGAGKTVLLEAIVGAFPLEAGSILLDGKDIRCLPVRQRRLGVVYRDHALFPHMTVAESIGYGLRMARCKRCALPTSCSSRASFARR